MTMSDKHSPRRALFLGALTLTAIVAVPADAAPGKTDDFPSGQQLYQDHCATCHGADATGNGPMAQVLKVAPADLTGISIRAGGTFPANQVVEIIRYGGNLAGHGTMPGHGTEVMPVWGRVFSEEGGGGKGGGAFSRRAVIELKRYLESIQRKAP